MKVIHASLSALLSEVKERGKVDGVRLAAFTHSQTVGRGVPRYTSWVIVSAHIDWEKWAEWRLLVGRQRAELSEHGLRVPERLSDLTRERLEEVRCWVDAAGLVVREGILADDAEALEGRLE